MKWSFLLLVFLINASLWGLPVIIPEKSNNIEKFAAAELAGYLEKVTGKKIPVVLEKNIKSGIPGYYIGKTARASALKITPPEKVNSFIIKYADNALFIIGRDGDGAENNDANPAGTLFGVYHFLHKSLGVRWIYPGKDGDFVPSKPAFKPSDKCDSIYIPVLSDRMFGGRVPSPEIRRFYRRNMFLAKVLHNGRGGHNKFVYKEYGKSDPEFFALGKNNKRNNTPGGSLCLSNPGLQRALIKYALDHKREYVSAHETDSVARCMCQNCNAMNGKDFRGPTGRYAPYRNMGERYAGFYRKLLDQCRDIAPGLKISAYAYQSYFYAPRKVKLDKNIHVGLVPDLPFPRRKSHTEFLRNEYKLWAASGASLYFRPNNFNGGYCMPEVWYDEFADELKFLCKLGINGVVIDGYSRQMWATRGLDQYICARLIACPDRDVGELFEEYLACFGAAAPEVRKYFKFFHKYLKDNSDLINTLHENSVRRWYFHGFIYAGYAHKIFPAEVLKSQLPTLARAAELAADDASAATRVAFLQAGLNHAAAASNCAAVFASKASAEVKKRTLAQLLTMRSKLPQFAVDNGYCSRIENNCWKISVPAQLAGTLLPLPEYCKVMTDPENTGEKAGFFKVGFDDSKWKNVSTWRSLESSNIYNYQYAFYRMKVQIPEVDGRRCILRLGAVDKDCTVWVNGKYAGKSLYDGKIDPEMWALPRSFDISDFVTYGADNLICIKIDNRGGGHGGLWKPSYIMLEKVCEGKPVYPRFRLPGYARRSKSGKYGVITVKAVADKRKNKFLALIAPLKLELTPKNKYRVRGEIRIADIGNARVDVSFRQYGKKGKNLKFTDLIYKHNIDLWEDFSVEIDIAENAVSAKLYLICRNLPANAAVSFRKIQIEKL